MMKWWWVVTFWLISPPKRISWPGSDKSFWVYRSLKDATPYSKVIRFCTFTLSDYRISYCRRGRSMDITLSTSVFLEHYSLVYSPSPDSPLHTVCILALSYARSVSRTWLCRDVNTDNALDWVGISDEEACCACINRMYNIDVLVLRSTSKESNNSVIEVWVSMMLRTKRNVSETSNQVHMGRR